MHSAFCLVILEELCPPENSLEYGDHFFIVNENYMSKSAAVTACEELGKCTKINVSINIVWVYNKWQNMNVLQAFFLKYPLPGIFCVYQWCSNTQIWICKYSIQYHFCQLYLDLDCIYVI